MQLRQIIVAFAMTLVAAPSLGRADVTLPRVLGDHMVLQRDMGVPIWGTATPDESIVVTFRDQKKQTTADAKGNWSVKLDPLKVGEPTTLTVTGKNIISLSDVVVGEVWVGSGQSNMDTDIGDYPMDTLLQEAAKQSWPNLRIHRSDVGNGWTQAGPKAFRFSAQLFYFGLQLQKALGVPVGLMEGAVRGSPTGSWISDETVKTDVGIQKVVANYEALRPSAEVEKRYNEAVGKWQQEVATARAAGTTEDKLPRAPSKVLPPGESKGPRGHLYETHIRPMIPYAIRGVLWDQGESGTNISQVGWDVVMRAMLAQWRRDWGQGDFAWLYVQKPSGAGCALDPQNPINKGANACAPLPQIPPQKPWDASGRLLYLRTMTNSPNTFMVTAQDLADGIHPVNKSGYATRGVRVALGAIYKTGVEYYGPTYASHRVEGNKLIITFNHVGQGLTVPTGQTLQGFSIAGADNRFYWADATISGDTVELTSKQVPAPRAALYAWSWDISWANLFNKDGLPATTFRTDDRP